MNPRKEFVNAIMSVLRLEQNIYVTASIEEIIDRIDITDYTMFIAYLGERNSDYEKPIQTIAKATEDFYEKKNKPRRLALSETISQITKRFYHAEKEAKEKLSVECKDENGEGTGKFMVNKTEVETRMRNIRPKEGHDFYIDGSHMAYADTEWLIERCGGLDILITLYIEDKHQFDTILEKASGINEYKKLGIISKIEHSAKENIDENVLGIINKKLIPMQWS